LEDVKIEDVEIIDAVKALEKFREGVREANKLEGLRESLGLTSSGFVKIGGAIKALKEEGFEISEMKDPLSKLVKEMDNLTDRDLIKSEDEKRAEKMTKMIEKWTGDDFFAFLPDNVETFGKTIDAAEDERQRRGEQGDMAGLETGTVAAAEFLSRPIEKQSDDTKQTAKNTKDTADALKQMTQTGPFIQSRSFK
jgi:methyl-accepting chemotaxis protein